MTSSTNILRIKLGATESTCSQSILLIHGESRSNPTLLMLPQYAALTQVARKDKFYIEDDWS